MDDIKDKLEYFKKIEKQLKYIVALNAFEDNNDILSKIIELIKNQNKKILKYILDLDVREDYYITLKMSIFDRKTFKTKVLFNTNIHFKTLIRHYKLLDIKDNI